MKIELKVVEKNELNILEKLLQLYLHDLSNCFLIDFDSKTAEYVYDNLDKYFDNLLNKAYFIKSDKDILGFILVDKTEDSNVLQEIFVLNNYKNRGIGEKAVCDIFSLYEGKWIVKSLPGSLMAEKFWIKAINNYTNGKYEMERIGKYNRAIFTFNKSNV